MKKLIKTFQIPHNSNARTILLSMRCGYAECNAFKLSGYNNAFTRWFWRCFVEVWPGESGRMVRYLKFIAQREPFVKQWREADRETN